MKNFLLSSLALPALLTAMLIGCMGNIWAMDGDKATKESQASQHKPPKMPPPPTYQAPPPPEKKIPPAPQTGPNMPSRPQPSNTTTQPTRTTGSPLPKPPIIMLPPKLIQPQKQPTAQTTATDIKEAAQKAIESAALKFRLASQAAEEAMKKSSGVFLFNKRKQTAAKEEARQRTQEAAAAEKEFADALNKSKKIPDAEEKADEPEKGAPAAGQDPRKTPEFIKSEEVLTGPREDFDTIINGPKEEADLKTLDETQSVGARLTTKKQALAKISAEKPKNRTAADEITRSKKQLTDEIMELVKDPVDKYLTLVKAIDSQLRQIKGGSTDDPNIQLRESLEQEKIALLLKLKQALEGNEKELKAILEEEIATQTKNKKKLAKDLKQRKDHLKKTEVKNTEKIEMLDVQIKNATTRKTLAGKGSVKAKEIQTQIDELNQLKDVLDTNLETMRQSIKMQEGQLSAIAAEETYLKEITQ